MEQFKQNSSYCVILLHEIYGVNEHMKYYANFLYQKGFDVYMPSLIKNDKVFSYEEEELAYNNFVDNIGFEKAKQVVEDLINRLSKEYTQIHLIGFSIGATTAWLCSNNNNVHKIIGFYGSRIRQYTDIVPHVKTELFYGAQEKSFNPIDLKNKLAIYPNVTVQVVEAPHGFADPYSDVYNEKLTSEILRYVIE